MQVASFIKPELLSLLTDQKGLRKMAEPEPTIDIDAFMKMKEVPASGRVTHVEAPAAKDLYEYAEALGFGNFKVEDWVQSAVEKGIIHPDEAERYSKLSVWGSYTIGKGKRKGEIGYYSGSPIFTAFKKLFRAYVGLREDSILVVPEEQFPALQKKYKGNKKAQAVLTKLQNNFDFMYNRKDWKPLA